MWFRLTGCSVLFFVFCINIINKILKTGQIIDLGNGRGRSQAKCGDKDNDDEYEILIYVSDKHGGNDKIKSSSNDANINYGNNVNPYYHGNNSKASRKVAIMIILIDDDNGKY